MHACFLVAMRCRNVRSIADHQSVTIGIMGGDTRLGDKRSLQPATQRRVHAMRSPHRRARRQTLQTGTQPRRRRQHRSPQCRNPLSERCWGQPEQPADFDRFQPMQRQHSEVSQAARAGCDPCGHLGCHLVGVNIIWRSNRAQEHRIALTCTSPPRTAPRHRRLFPQNTLQERRIRAPGQPSGQQCFLHQIFGIIRCCDQLRGTPPQSVENVVLHAGH